MAIIYKYLNQGSGYKLCLYENGGLIPGVWRDRLEKYYMGELRVWRERVWEKPGFKYGLRSPLASRNRKIRFIYALCADVGEIMYAHWNTQCTMRESARRCVRAKMYTSRILLGMLELEGKSLFTQVLTNYA